MKHHNKHFITALSMIVLIIVGAGLLLWNYEGDVVGMTAESTPSLNSAWIEIFGTEGDTFLVFNGMHTMYYDTSQRKFVVTSHDSSSSSSSSFDSFETALININSQISDDNAINVILMEGNAELITYSSQVDSLLSQETITEIQTAVLEKRNHENQILSLSSQLNIDQTAITKEETAINAYLSRSSQYSEVSYDVTTGHYSGTFGDSEIGWKGDRMYVTSKGKTYYSEKKNGRPVYYECTDQDCSSANLLSGDEAEKVKTAYKTAEDEHEKLQETINGEMEKCKKDEINCQLKAGTAITESVRKSAYLNSIYEQQERQAVGVLTGYLNKWINKVLGSWSRGVPAGICRIFGLEYYKNQGWMAMQANTSATQLQSTLIEHSRTIGIDGEKEEITENLYRYAYTIRLLSNTSIEWTTYLYNSCAQKDSTEQFYDYGALGSGDYYAFHYAGAEEQDMIFDCATEDCLYDQACVQFSDSAPVCVSLVHGEGFTTPTAGSDYDCAII